MPTTVETLSLKRAYKIGVVSLFFILFLIGTIALLKLNAAIGLSNAIVERSLNEMHHTMKLRMTVCQTAMPINDYIIHANPEEKANYLRFQNEADQQFSHLATIPSLLSMQLETLVMAKNEWVQAKEVAEAIIAIENPIGNPVAAKKMEQFDQLIDNSALMLSSLYDVVYAENINRHKEIHKIELEASLLVGLLFLAALIVVTFASIWLARAFFPPLKKMTHGMHTFSTGNLEHRIDESMPKEFRSLADGFNAMAEKLQEVHEELERHSNEDALTGCYNRRKFIKDYNAEFVRSQRYKRELSLMILDLDFFKAVNDNYGHVAGDAVLQVTAEQVRMQLRQADTLYRYGGEEFAVMLPETGSQGTEIMAERIRLAISEKKIQTEDKQTISITASIGVATFPQDSESEPELVDMADEALYTAKNNGRNRVSHYQNKRSENSDSQS